MKISTLEIENIGEPDFVIRYVPDPEKKAVQYFKTAIVCVILFFGSAFTIMTFIEDVSVSKVFAALHTRVTGQTYTGVGALEICFCIGLAIGIMVFYNHVGHKKITDDPTRFRWQCASTNRMWIQRILKPAVAKGRIMMCKYINKRGYV